YSLQSHGDHRDLHSVPTRRSSDLYPDGSYGGTLGSRNTQHFYPHGFEILANKIPLAAAVAAATRNALAKGSLVPPEIMSDRYLLDRKSTRLNSSHVKISYAVFCLK